MAGRSRHSAKAGDTDLVKGAELEPIRVVERELTSPDGRTVKVQVPVYPPFRLESATEKGGPSSAPPRRKETPRRKTG